VHDLFVGESPGRGAQFVLGTLCFDRGAGEVLERVVAVSRLDLFEEVLDNAGFLVS
jgi:hypothetical protein